MVTRALTNIYDVSTQQNSSDGDSCKFDETSFVVHMHDGCL